MLFEIRYLNLIFIVIKFYHDIPKPNIVIECNRIALQTGIVYYFKKGCNSAKIIGESLECNLQMICATSHNSLTIHKVSASLDQTCR